ncbi:hypothetical protein ACLOJK_024186 [Asimina triloba]
MSLHVRKYREKDEVFGTPYGGGDGDDDDDDGDDDDDNEDDMEIARREFTYCSRG